MAQCKIQIVHARLSPHRKHDTYAWQILTEGHLLSCCMLPMNAAHMLLKLPTPSGCGIRYVHAQHNAQNPVNSQHHAQRVESTCSRNLK